MFTQPCNSSGACFEPAVVDVQIRNIQENLDCETTSTIHRNLLHEQKNKEKLLLIISTEDHKQVWVKNPMCFRINKMQTGFQ